jgi:thiosulfate reductase/polysulfide reductase chain A
VWNFQLEGTGVTMKDFEATGMVSLSKDPKYRKVSELKFKTPSGKIEVLSKKLESAGLSSLKPYEPAPKPGDGQFRITFGRCPVHTQGHTVNNTMLSKEMPENVLWLNTKVGQTMGIADGEEVEITGGKNSARIKVKLTDLIHPEAVFMVHGFGHTLPVESRALGKGVSDNALMPGGLDLWDPAGGGVAMQEHFVTVRKIT